MSYSASDFVDDVCRHVNLSNEACESEDLRLAASEVIAALERAKVTVVIGLDGGIVQGASADHPSVAVIVADYDLDGAGDHPTICTVPQPGDADQTRAAVVQHQAAYDPKWVEQMARVIEQSDV